MVKKKMYRYVGRNGVLTSYVLLDGINRLDMYHLEAGKGKVLTDGETICRSAQIYAEELDKWTEIDDPNADNLSK